MTAGRPEALAPGLAHFLRVISACPDPGTMLEALINGPLARLGAWAGFLWVERDGVLEAIAGYRTAGILHELYARLPVDADLPVPLCFREGEVIVTDVPTMGDDFGTLRDHGQAWDDFRPDGHTRSLIAIPIVAQGVSLAVVGIGCREALTLNTLEVSSLDGIGAALGLWITHPSTPLPTGLVALGDDDPTDVATALTPRQQQIMRLARDGRSNASIAAHLGCSVSTVKQEVQRVQRLLRTPDRTAAAERAATLGLLQG